MTADALYGVAFLAVCFGAIFWRLFLEVRKAAHPSRSSWLWLGATMVLVILAFIAACAVGVFAEVELYAAGIDPGSIGTMTVIGAGFGAAAGTWDICRRRMQRPPAQFS